MCPKPTEEVSDKTRTIVRSWAVGKGVGAEAEGVEERSRSGSHRRDRCSGTSPRRLACRRLVCKGSESNWSQ